MSNSLRSLLAAALLVGGVGGVGALLGGCSDVRADVDSPATPSAAPTSPLPRPETRRAPGVDRAPLGLEVRYVDADGRFATVAPEDFPR